VDAALTDFSVAYLQASEGFVARRAFPAAGSQHQTDLYYTYTKADLARSDAQKYAGSGPTAGKKFGVGTTPYSIDVWSLHYDVTEHERANADPVLDPEEDAVSALVQDLMIAEDVQFAGAAFSTGVWGNEVTGGTNFTQWNDAASTPIETLRTGDTTIRQNTGRGANKLVMGHNAWASGLADHPDILDRIKHTQTGVVTTDLVGGILGVEVLVGSGIRNTADEGATASYSFNLGSHAMLIHSNSGGRKVPTAGRTFVWSGLTGTPDGVMTKRFEIPEEGAYPRVEQHNTFKHVVTASDLGYFLKSVVS
jgi:hypothetical protein